MITAMATPNPDLLVEATCPGYTPNGVMVKGLGAMNLCRATVFV
jgi:hypothetical protein